MELEYYKVEKQEKKKPLPCPHNDGCKCMVKNCMKCGWHPAVAKRRADAIMKKEG